MRSGSTMKNQTSVPTTAATWLRTSTPMPTPSMADSATESTPPPPVSRRSLEARSGPGWPASSGSPIPKATTSISSPMSRPVIAVGHHPRDRQAGAVGGDQQRRRQRAVAVLAGGADDPEDQEHEGRRPAEVHRVALVRDVPRVAGEDAEQDDEQDEDDRGQREADRGAGRAELEQLAGERGGSRRAPLGVVGQGEEDVLQRGALLGELVTGRCPRAARARPPDGR